MERGRPKLALAGIGFALAGALVAICTDPRPGPDVTVRSLYAPINHYTQGGAIGGLRSYAVGTISLNRGNEDALWIAETNEHPVIAQNLYRHKTDAARPGGRFEQLGLSWLKHGFFAVSGASYCACTFEPGHSGGDWLGTGCNDPYDSGLNGNQANLGPRYQVNASTGAYTYPFDGSAPVDDELDRRLVVADADLDPAANAGARWFVEGQYVTADDAAAGNGWNNASFREVLVDVNRNLSFGGALGGTTQVELPALAAWPLLDPTVAFAVADVVADGRFHLAAKVHDYGTGLWRYEYAVHNLTSHRSAQRFEVPAPPGSSLTLAGFHDVDYHSGEPYTNADWTIDADGPNGHVAWSGQTFATNPNANALRWGTMYNFWFDADQPPGAGVVEIALFRPGAGGEPVEFRVNLPVPGGSGLFQDDFETGTTSAWGAAAP